MYSRDFRKLALALFNESKSFTKVARLLRCGRSTVYRWVRHGIDVRPRHRHFRSWLDVVGPIVESHLVAHATTTLKHLCEVAREQTGRSVSTRSMTSIVRAIGYKRKRTKHRGVIKDNETQQAKKEAFHRRLKDAIASGSNVVSVDECYFSERIVPLYGYAKRGTPCIIKRPSGWKQQTLLLAISNRGHAFHRVIPGSCNGSKFREFVSNMPFPPGTVLIMDNVSFHHRDDAYAQRSFSPLYTPPYT